MTVEKPKPKQLLRPITTGAGSAMNQSQFLAFTCNSLEARESSRVHGAIGFGLASHWLKNWRASFKPITKRSNLGGDYMANFTPGWNIVAITLQIQAILFLRKQLHYACSRCFLSPGWNSISITWTFCWFSTRSPGLKILTWFLEPGKDLQLGLKPFSL